MSAIPAVRQTIVSFSDVNRSTILRSMFLKSDRLDKFSKVCLFFFDRGIWSGCLEKPNSCIASRPGGKCACARARDVDCGETCFFGFQLRDLSRDCGRAHRRQLKLLSPTIHVVGVAPA